ncbi:MAG: serine hydrolase [Actinomycetia bacterium]|nr:serine hydrolase [Actinomycetes bacterium]
MTRSIIRVSAVMAILLLAVIANITYIQVFKADEYRNASGNARAILQEYSRERGPILVGRQAVAKSVETSGDLKYQREYTSPEPYAPVTGFYSQVYGATGIERAENSVLSGTDDRLLFDRLQQLFAGRDPQGGAVTLGINASAQAAAFNGLGGRKGAVAAIAPKTGQLLALAQSPSFDPNNLASNNSKEVTRYYNSLIDDPNQPLLNRPLVSTNPPGSVFKVVTAAAALESGRFNPQSSVPCPAKYRLPGTSTDIGNAFSGDLGSISLTEALTVSCNTAFAWLANQLGDDAMRAQAEAFGFGTSFEVPMPSAAGRYPENPDAAQTAITGYGQGDVQTTALNMAQVAAAIANSGLTMAPYLVTEISGPDLKVLDTTTPESFQQAMSPDNARDLTAMMVSVVQSGTGSNGQIPGVRVAGKTGTAETTEGAANTTWFIAFAPADNPEVAVAVVLEEGGGGGNSSSGPIARSVMEAILGR